MKEPQRNAPPCSTVQRGNYKWRVNSDFSTEALSDILVDPESLMEVPAEPLKPSFKDHVTFVVGRYCDGLDREVVIKRYLPKNPLRALRNLFRVSPAERAFARAEDLLGSGIPTAPAIATATTSGPGLTRPCYLVTEKVRNSVSLRTWSRKKVDPTSRRRVVRELGKVMGRLHREGCSHTDPSLGNFMVSGWDSGSPRVVLIDLDALRRRKSVTLACARANLEKLLRRIPMTARQRLWFFAEYQAASGMTGSTRELIDRLDLENE